MKKIVFTLAALLSMTMAFAEGEDKTASVANVDAANYELKINVNSLSNTLHLDSEEKDAVSFIADDFSRNLAKAGAANGDERTKLYKKAVNRNLSDMRVVLTDKQYHEYVLLLNTTLNNRGLNK